MPKLKTYRGFISHAWTYNSDYYSLEDKLKQFPRFKWHNYSVPKHDPLYSTTEQGLINALRNRIRLTNHVLIIAGMYVNYRDWIQEEIHIALNIRKLIIGIKPWGQQRIPGQVQDVADKMVGWNIKSIVTAIRKVCR